MPESSPRLNYSIQQVGKQLIAFLTSFRLASVLLFFLTLVVLFGTLNQTEESLYDSQKKYFESLWIVDTYDGYPIFLPGLMLLSILFFINLSLGILLKMRKSWKAFGLYISHSGILVLLAGGLVTQLFSWEGNMVLYPSMEGNEALSYHYWQLEIIPVDSAGKAKEALVIPQQELLQARHRPLTFTADSLPFTVTLSNYHRNCFPMDATAPMSRRHSGKVVDGFTLLPRPPAKEAEANLAGVYVTLNPKTPGSGASKEAILWAHRNGGLRERIPYTATFNDQNFALQLVRERLSIPFTLRLEEFIFQKYGGSTTPKNYQSNVIKMEEGRPARNVEIKMNEPLRHRGYTFFQASYGPSNARPGEQLYTVFAVVKNPADHWPLIALVITFAGLVIHLVMKLSASQKRSTPASS